MPTPSSDNEVAQFEDALSQVAIATWNRVRSHKELTDFINRHHNALSDIEL